MRIYPIIESINIIVSLTEVSKVPVVGSYVPTWRTMTQTKTYIILTTNKRIRVTRVAVAIFLTRGFKLQFFAQQHPHVSMDASTSAAI